jgi:hypothetical protein
VDHLNDLFPDLHIIDAPGAIPLRRPDVDQGIEFNDNFHALTIAHAFPGNKGREEEA